MSRCRGFPWASFSVAPSCFCSVRSWPTIRPAVSSPAAITRPGEAGNPRTSERGLQPDIEGPRPRRTDRTRISERRAAIGEIRNSAGVEKRSGGRIAIIKDIVGTRVDLERLVALIRGVEIENCIGRQPRCLIGFVADKKLIADEQRVATDLERVGDRIIDAGLDPVSRDCGNSVAGNDLDVAIDVGEGAIGTDLKRVKKSRVDQIIPDLKRQL